MQVVWGELGDSPLESLSILSSEIAVPLLKTLIRHGSLPDATALELTDSMQDLVSSRELTHLQARSLTTTGLSLHLWPWLQSMRMLIALPSVKSSA